METDTDNFQELDVRKKGLYSFSTITETTENPEDYSCIYGGGNLFSNLNTISSFSHVKEVYLDDNQIRDIGEIKDCTQVEILVLSYNYIEDVTSLETLSSLSHLDLSSNKTLKDISPLGNITSLRTLNISGTKVSEKQYRWLCKKLPQCQIIY
jgi:Leucine-rich repeat (LRR) protein